MNPGSETLHVRLQRTGQQPWGFRLQGGADFAVPLSIQLVNPGSLSEQYNVHPGDAVLAINGKDTSTLDHEAAKYEILMAQSELNLVLQRGAVSIWKPKVTPLSELKPSELRQIPGTDGEVYVQKTSLAADKREPLKIGTYNRTARPFAGFGGGSAAPPAPAQAAPGPGYGGPQYGGPQGQQPAYGAPPPAQPYHYDGSAQGQYDDYQAQQMAAPADHERTTPGQSPALPARTCAVTPEPTKPPLSNPHIQLSPTYLAVHDETSTSATPGGSKERMRSVSPTCAAVQAEDEQRNADGSLTGDDDLGVVKQSRSFRMLEQELGTADQVAVTAGGSVAGIRSVRAPITKPPSERPQQQHPTCGACGGLIVGVFVKISGEPLHPECFKCTQCGKNLKNQGHFTVEGKRYCDTCTS